MPSDQAKKKPRRMTEFRRAQNRLSQQRYRAKRKQLAAELDGSAVQSQPAAQNAQKEPQTQELVSRPPTLLPNSTPVNVPDVNSAVTARVRQLKPLLMSMQQVMASAVDTGPPSSGSSQGGIMSQMKTPENHPDLSVGNAWPAASSSSSDQRSSDGTSDVVSSILQVTSGYVADRHAAWPSSTPDLSLPDPASTGVDFLDPLLPLAPVTSTSSSVAPYTSPPLIQDFDPQLLAQHVPYYASPRVNTLTIVGLNIHVACVRNALQLGISSDELKFVTASPFFHEEGQLSTMAALQASLQSFSFLSPDLQPVPAQLIVPHRAWLDTIPLPGFRAAVLQHYALLSQPWDGVPEYLLRNLSQDLSAGGLVCWEGISSKGRSGIAWDGRSWEVKRWFLQKWEFIFGHGSGDVQRGMHWWAAMRGEEV